MTACTPLLSICANHYPKIISSTRLYVNAGQTPTTAIPVGAGAWAGDEAADEVTATGAQTADPGKTLCSPDRHQHGGRSHFNLLTFFLFSFPRLNVRLWFNTETYYNRSCLEKVSSISSRSLSPAGRTTPPVAARPGAEVTVAAVATAETGERKQSLDTVCNSQ